MLVQTYKKYVNKKGSNCQYLVAALDCLDPLYFYLTTSFS